MIRSSKATIKFANDGKLEELREFINEYRRVATLLVDHYWNHGLKFDGFELDVKNEILNFPSMLPVDQLPTVESFLSGRALKCLSTQVCGIIKAAINKRVKDRRLAEYLTRIEKKLPDRLIKRLAAPLVKPSCNNIETELNSICCDVEHDPHQHFDSFFRISSIRNDKKLYSIKLPINYHRHFNKWKSIGVQLNSFLISNDDITFRFEVEYKNKEVGNVVGADQGYKTVITLSDGQTTPTADCHLHTLESVIEKLARKRKGSAAYEKAQDHRKNFVNWSINQLNLSSIKQINLEEIVNINFGKRVSRKMQAWTNTIIRDKMISFANEHEVHVNLQDSSYRSQRCCKCGNVRKSNRKGKIYTCKHCGNIMDADLNAAKNHEIELPTIPFEIRGKGYNLGNGFFWNISGIVSFSGEELTVPLDTRIN